jgi:hypothetical protein
MITIDDLLMERVEKGWVGKQEKNRSWRVEYSETFQNINNGIFE